MRPTTDNTACVKYVGWGIDDTYKHNKQNDGDDEIADDKWYKSYLQNKIQQFFYQRNSFHEEPINSDIH